MTHADSYDQYITFSDYLLWLADGKESKELLSDLGKTRRWLDNIKVAYPRSREAIAIAKQYGDNYNQNRELIEPLIANEEKETKYTITYNEKTVECSKDTAHLFLLLEKTHRSKIKHNEILYTAWYIVSFLFGILLWIVLSVTL